MVRIVLSAALMLAMASCLAGCHSKTEGNSTWTLTYGTSLTIDSTAQKVDGETATAGFDVEDWLKGGIVGWLFNKPEPKQPIPEATDAD